MTSATAVLDRTPDPTPTPPRRQRSIWFRPVWRRFTPLQLLVIGAASWPPLVAVSATIAGALGAIDVDTMIDIALAAGENPGNIIFGAMFLASPVQWITGRSQVRVRRYLGLMFFVLGLLNGLMFVIETGIGAAFSQPFLIAGSIALLASVPLALTSPTWMQRAMGMRRWQLLHKLTYLVAAALMLHVLFIGEVGVGFFMIAAGFIARIPAVRRRLTRRSRPSLPVRPTAA
ncbi:MAG: ferric reductase-like transmembrane domain-containing protein [Actinomycetota bacterium]